MVREEERIGAKQFCLGPVSTPRHPPQLETAITTARVSGGAEVANGSIAASRPTRSDHDWGSATHPWRAGTALSDHASPQLSWINLSALATDPSAPIAHH